MLLCENVETTNVMGKIPLGGNVFGFYTVWFLRPRKFLFLFLFVCLFLHIGEVKNSLCLSSLFFSLC